MNDEASSKTEDIRKAGQVGDNGAIGYEKEGRIAIFSINNPRVLNAVNMKMAEELHRRIVEFRDDTETWVGIITGAGDRAFSVGADIKDMLPFIKEHRGIYWAEPALPWRRLDLWKPLIAAVNGPALGGGLEMVLGCDIRIASEKARFGCPEVTLGVIAGWGGTQRLPRMVPWCKAAEILLMGKVIDAQEAYRIGLVNAVVPPDKVMSTAKEWADIICKAGPIAVRGTKEAMIRGSDLTLDEGLRLEHLLASKAAGTEDFTEGTTAFVEKRKPIFKGR